MFFETLLNLQNNIVLMLVPRPLTLASDLQLIIPGQPLHVGSIFLLSKCRTAFEISKLRKYLDTEV
jgi:hypothetical protein